MSYVGTTAASSVANPPNRIDTALLSQRSRNESTSVFEGGSLWTYNSTNLTTDLTATAGGFFTDGGRLGMRNGDILIASCVQSTLPQSSTSAVLLIGIISGVNSTDDTASVSTEGFITSTATAAGGG
jgi:hypothetical protein